MLKSFLLKSEISKPNLDLKLKWLMQLLETKLVLLRLSSKEKMQFISKKEMLSLLETDLKNS